MIDQNDIASPEYMALLRERYTRPGWGASGYHHWELVRDYATELGAESILDFGCGRGTLKKRLDDACRYMGFDVREYDPGIVGKDVVPEPADLVVSTDVLEHIEPDRVEQVLRHLRALARKGAFLIIAMSPSRETLADGRNAHLSIHQWPRWRELLIGAGFTITRSERRKGQWVWCV